jgi:hypothetical protein
LNKVQFYLILENLSKRFDDIESKHNRAEDEISSKVDKIVDILRPGDDCFCDKNTDEFHSKRNNISKIEMCSKLDREQSEIDEQL